MIAAAAAASVEELAARLACLHVTGGRPLPARLLRRRLAFVKRSLDASLARIAASPPRERDPRASEWLLDNVPLLAASYEQVREGLPASFYKQLPRLAAPKWRGEARAYRIARALVEERSGQFDPDRARRLLRAYAPPAELTIGELWALPALLRLALLEGVAAGAAALAGSLPAHDARARRLWTEPPLTAPAGSIASYVQSLRTISTLDWTGFVESVSVVEKALGEDPAGVYRRMDEGTRDRYRKAVERVARSCGMTEAGVALGAVEMAFEQHGDPRRGHVGFYLLGEGRARLVEALGGRPERRLVRQVKRRGPLVYILSILVVSAAAWAWLAGPALESGSAWRIVLVALVGLVPASAVGVALVNWLVTQLVPPRVLPKLNPAPGVSEAHRTAVVVPALFADTAEVEEVLRQLELNQQGNVDPNVEFVLLADFKDASAPSVPSDATVLAAAEAGIRRLNERAAARAAVRAAAASASPGRGAGPFWLFVRPRRWNEAQGCWMGWERKRGKLRQFNALVLGRPSELELRVGAADPVERFRYALVVDADTFLPQGVVSRLVNTMAHPLNAASVLETGRVIEGYSVLQPRVEILPPAAGQTPFAFLMEENGGLDLYSGAASNVYQDLFGEGNFGGKGLLDIGAFERSLEGRVPENALLSHDLFEGVHGRAALVSDVVVYEDFPAQVLSYLRRQHRWIRGDWQLAPWLLRRVPAEGGGRLSNPLSLLSRWKILDNLRRSAYAASLLALLLAGWTLLPGEPWRWLTAAILLVGTPVVLSAATEGRAWVHARRHRKVALRPLAVVGLSAARVTIMLLLLPLEAAVEVDAVARTLVRLLVTRRHLLDWNPAAQTARFVHSLRGPAESWRHMAIAPMVGAAAAALVAVVRPIELPAAAPLLLAWMACPAIAARLGRPVVRRGRELLAADAQLIRGVARRTWGWFEQFAGPEDHWLPPDNFQEGPPGVVAHRTSPTNAGLLALSAMAAYDLGYIPTTGLTATTENLLDTLSALERYRGHVLNWYDTRTLAPLEPRYVSTVDSGNLAAALLALAVGCEDAAEQPVRRTAAATGLADVLGIVREQLWRIRNTSRTAIDPLIQSLSALMARARHVRDAPDWVQLLLDMTDRELPRLGSGLATVLEEHGRGLPERVVAELRTWVDLTASQVEAHRREKEALLPWLFLPTSPAPPDAGVHAERLAPWRAALAALQPSTPANLPDQCDALERSLQGLAAVAVPGEPLADWLEEVRERLDLSRHISAEIVAALRGSAARARALVDAMDFAFLYDADRALFRIGYDASAGRPDGSYYDLLASEARLASLVAIAKRDAPGDHWVHLGRPFARRDRKSVLLSWGGSMFEYLLPGLLMRTPERTLLGLGCRSAVAAQIDFGRRRRIPWGISESGYADVDAAGNYQYHAFGVPSLALRAHAADRLVVSSYSSMLALGWAPRAASENVRALCRMGMLGPFGLYEAIDYGTAPPAGPRRGTLVRTYMAHHQGMALVSAANLLTGNAAVRRFHRSPGISAVSYLLYEGVPQRVRPEPLATPRAVLPARTSFRHLESWRVPSNTPLPEALVVSNGELSALLTDRGGGGLRFAHAAVTRWEPDPTLEPYGQWTYIQDLDTGHLWGATSWPCGAAPGEHDVMFGPQAAEFHRRHDGISSRLTVTVAPDTPIELRRLSLTNETRRARRLRVVSYGEVVLGRAGEDLRHPAFSKLFVESSFAPEQAALVFHRRTASASQEQLYLAHGALAVPGRLAGWTADRGRFLGRHGSIARPHWLATTGPLGGDYPDPEDAGGHPPVATLDPVYSLAYDVTLPPDAATEIAFLTAVGGSGEEALRRLDAYRTWTRVQWGFDEARKRAETELERLGIPPSDMPALQALLSAAVYPFTGHPRAAVPPPASVGAARQRALWSLGISGDLPVLLLRVPVDDAARSLLELVVRGHAYWRRNGVRADLLVLDEDTGYAPPLREALYRLVAETGGAAWLNMAGGVFHVSAGRLDPVARAAVESGGSVVLDALGAPLLEQLRARRAPVPRLPRFVPVSGGPPTTVPTPPVERPTDLLFDNGFGGFTPDGREYVIQPEGPDPTPAPWINVVANPEFGFTMSEAGAGYTWCRHSGEHRLTPWTNDPVTDAPGEVLYIRDEETAEFWSPTPRPVPAPAPYQVRHGAGYTRFLHASHGLRQETTCYTAREDPVKLVRLRLENLWPRQRRFTLTYYARWVMGPRPTPMAQNVVTALALDPGAILAWQIFTDQMAGRVAFLTSSERVHGATGDRGEFLGTPGDVADPAGLRRIGLAQSFGAGLDPCGALQVHVDLAPGATAVLHFALGEGADRKEALELARRYRDPASADVAFEESTAFWNDLLGRVQVRTPDPGMDLLLNRWLPYQVVSCRVWGRSGLYQSSGAFGFRDQLQDVLALLASAPELVRAHILETASRQFAEGDVLHWWQPHTNLGLRSRCSDDLLWLPYVVAAYVEATGDVRVLDEPVVFLAGEPLGDAEVERYHDYPQASSGTLYDHCMRALDRGSTAGAHGLPLIGSCDWNDGMNRVGAGGAGESVWLAWFLYAVAMRFAPICEARGDQEASERLRAAAERARAAAEDAWDGDWYRRAYYDDGTPLGSAASDEGRIDSIAQSWAVLSGAADAGRARAAMTAVERELVRAEDRVVLLLAPPFDRGARSPGYIRAYPPGVRENGGQYTHAAAWVGWAFARLGDSERAIELFRLLDPIRQGATREAAEHYRVEPYVLAGDICGAAPHTRRGGWTWYTGSAAWLYRLGTEEILGLRMRGGALEVDPRLPPAWDGYDADVAVNGRRMRVRVRREADAVRVSVLEPDFDERGGSTVPVLI